MKRQDKSIRVYHPAHSAANPEHKFLVHPREIAGYKKNGWDIKPFKKDKPKEVLED